MKFYENPKATIEQLERHKEVLLICGQSQNIKDNIKGTQKRIDELVFEYETNKINRSGAT